MDVTANDLAAFATLMGALSVASERLVEIIRGLWARASKLWGGGKDGEKDDLPPQLLAIAAGIVTTYLAWDPVSQSIFQNWQNVDKTQGVLAIGVLASGGSGLWNSVLGYANQVKNIRKMEVEKMRKK